MSQPNPAAPQGGQTADVNPPADGGGDDDHVEPTRDPALAEARRESMKWKRQAREHQAELERLRTATQTDAEKAVAAARGEGAAQYKAMYEKAMLNNAALTILSRKGVTATELALGALDVSGLEIGENGSVDIKELESRVEEVLRRYPMLSAPPSTTTTGSPPVPFANGGDQRRVTEAQLASIKDRDQLNKTLRWALGGSE